MVFIYALCDPDTEMVRYVGKAKCIPSRLKSHRNEKRSTRKCRWLTCLCRRGVNPLVRILEEVADDKWEAAERLWIFYFRDQGCDLVNHTDGGEGLRGASPETRAKLSVLLKRRMADPSFRAKVFTEARNQKISAALSGKPKSREHVAKLPQNQPGRSISEEHKRKLLASKSHRWTPEEIAIIREQNRGNSYGFGNRSRKGQKRSAEELLKASLSLRGKKKSADHRKRISEGQLRAWARRKAAIRNQGDMKHVSLREARIDEANAAGPANSWYEPGS